MELDQFRDVDLVIDRANDSFVQKQFVSQGDYKGRSLTVQVTDNGVVGEVAGLTLNLQWHNKASGLSDLSAFTVIDKASSVFRIEYPEHMMTPGEVIANIQVLQDGKSTFLKSFTLTVQQLAGQPAGIVDKAEFSALVAILADSNKFRTDIDRKADKTFVDAQLEQIALQVNRDDTTYSIQKMIDSCPDNSVIYFPQSFTIDIESLNVNGKRLTFIGHGATINCTSSLGAFYKTDHNKKLIIIGFRFIGSGKAINWVTSTSDSQYDEFSFQDCRFENADYGIYLDGVREGRIINCSFEGATNKGIYRVRSINHDVIGCYWKNTVYGINDDGDGTPYSAGLRVNGGTMIGCQYGIRTSMVDYCAINDVMIDYCDNPLVILGVDILIAKGCYITTRTLSPSVYVDKGNDGRTSREIRIIGNTISVNTDNILADAMILKNISSGEISSNTITFWWRTGIDFSGCTNLIIEKNKINPDGGSTALVKNSIIESSLGNSTNKIFRNEVTQPISTINAQISGNVGYVTEARGEVIAPAGTNSYTVAHGLSYTPSKTHVKLSPTNLEASSKQPFISSVDDTNLVIGFTSTTINPAGVSWSISKGI